MSPDHPQPHPLPPAGADPRLGVTLRADYEALRNDFEQANELSADLQRQLAGKSNEFATLKQIFEKTSRDLAHLQSGISELREERHRLANEAMRATYLELKLQETVAQRDQLKLEIESLRAEQAKAVPGTSGHQPGGQLPSPKVAAILSDIVKSVDQLRPLLETSPGKTPLAKSLAKPSPLARSQPVSEFINISYQA